MTTKEKIKVMQAYSDGKKIEVKDNGTRLYIPVTIEPSWNWCDRTYRIVEEPEHIPFDFSNANFLVGTIIKNKESGTISLILEADLDFIYISGRFAISYQKLFDDYIFPNGNICGKQSAS